MGVKGFVFSVEVLLAAVFLFAMLLLVLDLNHLSKDYDSQQKLLSHYTEGTITALHKTGALKNLMEKNDDTLLKNITDSLPNSICSQIQIYDSTPQMPNLYYSYTSPNCTTLWSTPSHQQTSSYLNRTNSSNIKMYFIKAINYAKE